MDGFRTAVRQKLEGNGPIYRIQVGAFRNRAYAEAFLARVRAQFPEAYLTRD
jgi:cell division septation protein DedD